ncbi:MAG: hypothetical protein ACJAZO_003360 [Myxococcota bacterium]|jgi:hypothetical protein
MSHNPAIAPDPAIWLTLSESTRQELVQDWHAQNPNPMIHLRVPDAMHSRMHVAVENQMALDEPKVTAVTLDRLTDAGLNRHVAAHAIIDVFMRQMVATMTSGQPFDSTAYAAALTTLSGADIVARRLGKS